MSVPVTWSASDDESLRSFAVHASYDAGRTWHVLAERLPRETRRFDWLLPASAGLGDVRVRVVAEDLRFQTSSAGADRSFAISAGAPDIRVTLVPKTVVARAGARLAYDVIVENLSGANQSFAGWIEAYRADGVRLGASPIAGPKSVTLAPGRTVVRSLGIRIPDGQPASGPYRVAAFLGSYPSGVVASSSFEFTVED